jgi:putative salt-induced outer membrane protein YdiY
LCLGTPAAAHAQKTDVVTLANGDRITCEIDNLQSGLLTVKTDDMGTLRIEWDKVRSVTSSRSFEIETTGGTLVYGSLAAGGPRQIVVVGTDRVTLDQLSVFRISNLSKAFWKHFGGTASVGGSATKSSGVGQISASLEVRARWPSYEWFVSYDSVTTFREDESDSGRYTGRLSYSRDLPDRWFALGFSQVESNPDLGFDVRGTVGGGLGRNLIQSNRRVFQLAGGLAASREKPLEAGGITNLEALSLVRYSAVKYDYPKSETTLTLSVLPSMSDPGRVRASMSAKMSRAFFTNDFVFAISAFDDYDNRPPAGAVNTNDVGFSFSVGWKF